MKTNSFQALLVSVIAVVNMTACDAIPEEEVPESENAATDSYADTSVPTYGDTIWVTACDHTRVTADWGSGCKRETATYTCNYNPPPGYVILDNRVTVWSSNNGSRTNQTLAGGLDLVTETTLKNAYDSAINLAVKYKDQAIAGQLSTQYAQNEASRIAYQSNFNSAQLTVSAQAWGSCFNRKRGWEEDSLEVKLFYVGSNDYETILTSLRNLFGLWDPILLLNGVGLNPGALVSLPVNMPIKVKDAAFTTNNYYLSVQRSTSAWDGYGAAAMEWLPAAEGQQIRAGTYPLSTFMARHPEVTLTPGSYYRVKLANGVGGWHETVRLVKLY